MKTAGGTSIKLVYRFEEGGASIADLLGGKGANLEAMGRGFGATDRPLLASVRSGSRFSMPGMMDTVLNLGLNDETVRALAEETGDRRFALDAYRRFIQIFAKVVLRADPEPFGG